MSAPWLALVESNTSGTGRLFARAARELGCRPILLASDPARYADIAEDGVDLLRVDTSNVESILGACRGLAGGGLAGVTTSSEYFVVLTAAVARALGLPGADEAALATCRDKHLQRERLARAGVAVPAFRCARSADDARAAAGELGPPVVVKPVSGSGSAGVRRCASAGEAADHAASLLAVTANERGQSVPRKVLVESLVSGDEFSVETMGRDVIGVTAKRLGPLPHFVEIGHEHPADVAPARASALAGTALAALDALGLGWGPAHTELRWSEAGPVVIEVNPRLAGGFIPELVRLARGVDLVLATVDRARGGEPSCANEARAYAALRFVLAPREGTYRAAHGVDEAAAVPSIVEARIYPRPGAAVLLRNDFRDRVGHVIARAATAAGARSAVEQALGAIRLDVDPAGAA